MAIAEKDGTKLILTSCEDFNVRAFVLEMGTKLSIKLNIMTPGTYITKFLKYKSNLFFCGCENGKFKEWNLDTNTFTDKEGHFGCNRKIKSLLQNGSLIYSCDQQGGL